MRANLEAWHSDLKADAGEGFAIYPITTSTCCYAASMDRQSGIATQAGKDYTKRTSDTMSGADARPIRPFRRSRGSDQAPRARDSAAAFDFSQGYAKLKLGDSDFAKAYLAKVRKGCRHVEGGIPQPPAARLVGVLANILDGEITRMAGDVPGAIAKFETAVKLDDEMEYDEPEPLPFPARHWLGAALIEAKRFADAESVYKKDLEQHPHNGWALLGLQQALKAQGKTDPAVDADLAKSWSRSDTWIKPHDSKTFRPLTLRPPVSWGLKRP